MWSIFPPRWFIATVIRSWHFPPLNLVVYLLPAFCSLFAQNQRAAGHRIIIVRQWLILWYAEITQGNGPQSPLPATDVNAHPIRQFHIHKSLLGGLFQEKQQRQLLLLCALSGQCSQAFHTVRVIRGRLSRGRQAAFLSETACCSRQWEIKFSAILCQLFLSFFFLNNQILVEMSLERILERSTAGTGACF